MSAVNCTTQALLANAAVKTIVSDRINPGFGPQSGTLPDLVITRISEAPVYGLSRASSLTGSRIQVECRGRKWGDAEKLGAAVIAALRDCSGVYAGRFCIFQSAGSDTEDHADDASVFRRIIDFYAWSNEPD